MSIQNLAGQTLGQYELRELLGEGGMGAVYRAFQRTLEREVAIKILPASLAAQSGYIERFTREARTAAALEHQNIVAVYDYGTQGSISYVVMRLLTGGTLADRLSHSVEENRPLPSLQEISDITRQLASALDYAHSQGVIHRDIKANNIMFDRQGTPFVVDFGIAKLLNATSALTGTGVAMGTPSYMAPEQWQGKDIGPAADQYALAVLVYAMLTGKMPFEADSPYQLMHKHMFDVPTPIHNYRADLPEALQKIFSRAFEKEPKNRFGSTSEFAKAIDEAVRVSPMQEPSGFFVTPLPVRKFNVPLQATPPNMEGPTITPTGSKMAQPDAMQATVADMTSGGSPPTSTPPPISTAGVPAPPPSSNKRLPLAILGGATALVILIILASVLLRNGDDNGRGDATQPTTDPLVIAQGILTATAQAATTSADNTMTAEAVVAQATDESTDVPIPSSPSPTATATTATSPTATRTHTPNAVETLEARATRDSLRTAAAQATEPPTETPTSMPSPTPTARPSSTPTRQAVVASSVTSTATRTQSPVPSPTATNTSTTRPTTMPAVTATSTPSSSPSPTPTFTATMDTTATYEAEATDAAAMTSTHQAGATHQSATQNAVQTLVVRATADANKTLTVRATAGAGPTQTAQAIAAIQIAETSREVNLRAEPNTSAAIVATLRQGTRLTIIGTNDAETWFNVRLSDGTEGWIRADLLTVFGPPTATPSPTPEPQVQEFDGVPMVLVPAGCFVMGSDDTFVQSAVEMGLPQAVADAEKPPEKICFDAPFWIDQYEVTNGQFDQFNGQAEMPPLNDDADKPREQLTWTEANAFCEQRGARLPTEAEWEYAARGPANLLFPWGNTFEPDYVAYLENSDSLAQPVGSHPDGVSWVGAYDMSGNVWEWTSTLFAVYPYVASDGREGEGEGNRVIRGGSYQDLDEFLRTAVRAFWIPPTDAYPTIGVRCARDAEERG